MSSRFSSTPSKASKASKASKDHRNTHRRNAYETLTGETSAPIQATPSSDCRTIKLPRSTYNPNLSTVVPNDSISVAGRTRVECQPPPPPPPPPPSSHHSASTVRPGPPSRSSRSQHPSHYYDVSSHHGSKSGSRHTDGADAHGLELVVRPPTRIGSTRGSIRSGYDNMNNNNNNNNNEGLLNERTGLKYLAIEGKEGSRSSRQAHSDMHSPPPPPPSRASLSSHSRPASILKPSSYSSYSSHSRSQAPPHSSSGSRAHPPSSFRCSTQHFPDQPVGGHGDLPPPSTISRSKSTRSHTSRSGSILKSSAGAPSQAPSNYALTPYPNYPGNTTTPTPLYEPQPLSQLSRASSVRNPSRYDEGGDRIVRSCGTMTAHSRSITISSDGLVLDRRMDGRLQWERSVSRSAEDESGRGMPLRGTSTGSREDPSKLLVYFAGGI